MLILFLVKFSLKSYYVVSMLVPRGANSYDLWLAITIQQVLLGAASLAVNAGNGNVYVLILSECRPLVNLFSCGELLEHRDQGWLYQVNIEQLRKRISMPVGSCQLSIPLEGQGTSKLFVTFFSEKIVVSYSNIT